MPARREVAVLFVCTGNICRSPTAEGVFLELVRQQGLESCIHEVANVAALTEQKGALKRADRVRFLQLLGGLRKQVDHATGERIWGDVYELSLKHKLTSYDARYLELAKRMELPLATQDGDLRAAPRKERVPLFAAPKTSGRR